MNFSLFQKIWKDSVWSKIISVIIIALITFSYNAIVAKEKNFTILESFFHFLAFQNRIMGFHFNLFLYCCCILSN
jgi:hypothetical protein